MKFKEICTSAPILAYADFMKPFKLPDDACVSRLGAILYQNQNGINSVIGYVSWSLSKTEQKYLAHKLTFLELKWAITDWFLKYLYDNDLDIYTDNNPQHIFSPW